MGFVLFTESGTFDPATYGLKAGDVLHVKVVGGGGGGGCYNGAAGTAGSASSFGSILTAEGGNAGQKAGLPTVQEHSNRGSGQTNVLITGTTYYCTGTGGEGWMPGYTGGMGMPAVLYVPFTLSSSSSISSVPALCNNVSQSIPPVGRTILYSATGNTTMITGDTTASTQPFSKPGSVLSYYTISSTYYYQPALSCNSIGYGAGGSGGLRNTSGTAGFAVNYNSGGNSGQIRDTNYLLPSTDAIAITVGAGGAGGTYAGGGAVGCVAIWW